MRAGDPSRSPNQPDQLAALNRIPDRDERLGQVEVSGDDTSAMVDVHDVAGEKEVVYQGDDTAVRGANRIAGLAGEIHAPVAARQASVEESPRSEGARDPRAPRPKERLRPEL